MLLLIPPLLTEKLHYMRAFQCPPRIRGIAEYFPIFPGTPCVPGGQRIGWIPFSVEWRGTPIRNKTKGPRLYLRKRGVRHNSRKRAPVSVLSFLFGQAQREEKERWGMALRRQLRRWRQLTFLRAQQTPAPHSPACLSTGGEAGAYCTDDPARVCCVTASRDVCGFRRPGT